MCVICQNPNTPYLGTSLNCSYCPDLSTFPECPNLSTPLPLLPILSHLYCSDCRNLSLIPILPSLTFLDCGGCINLSTIPILPSLSILYCYDCRNLSTIPILPFFIKYLLL